MSYSKKILIIFSFCVISCVNFAGYIGAMNLPFINKPKIRLSVLPGQKSYGDLIIENPTSAEKSMKLYLEDWYYVSGGDGSKEFLPANTFSRSCASWITFSPAEFTIPAFGRQRLSYSVKVPLNAVGGYYAALFFEMLAGRLESSEKGMGAGINLTVRIATLFYVEAEGTIKRKWSIGNLTLNKDKTSNSLLIQLDFNNTGNVDITAGGTFHIVDKQGMIYARGEFSSAYTFPGDTAKLVATWKDNIPRGKYDLILTLNLGKAQEETGFGRGPVVTKEAQLEIGANGEVLRVGVLK